MTASWAALALAELIAAVSEADDPADVITSAQRVGATVQADVTAVVRDGAVVTLFGDGRDARSADRFAQLTRSNERYVRLPDRGHMHVTRGGRGPGISIVLARSDREFTVEERGFVQAAGRLLDHAAGGLSQVRDRRQLLDVLGGFQAAMLRGDALVDVLRGLAVAALELLHVDRVELSWTDPLRGSREAVTARRATSRTNAEVTWLAYDVQQPGSRSGSFAVARVDPSLPLDRDDADIVRLLADQASIALHADGAELQEPSEELISTTSDSFLEQVALHLAELDRCSVTMMLVDLDGFDAGSDRHEQARRDRVLTTVSDRLRTCVRETDLIGRLGNDQFLLVCPGISEVGAHELAQRFQRVVHEPIFADGLEYCVTASIGIAGASSGDRPSDLVANADQARQRAQQRGDAQIDVFGSTPPQPAAALLSDADFASAFHEGELRVELQPVVALPARRVCGFSAVASWDHRSSGSLTHAEVREVAARCGLAVELDRAVIDESLRLLASASPERPISMQICGDTLVDGEFVAWLGARFEAHGVRPELLTLEVPESVVVGDEAAESASEALRTIGVLVTLGEFGTGATSVRSLQAMPIDGVSLDRTLTDTMVDDPAAAAIVAAVLEVASVGNLAVTIHGVDDDARVDFLNNLAAMPGTVEVRGQGELFGPPSGGRGAAPGFVAAPWSSGTPVG